ncbi:MAG: hypothetical protein HAW60_03720 [Bdellovibrionales bacterium]|nr:hypothetical protein [Bdellovibrionales bacterium]
MIKNIFLTIITLTQLSCGSDPGGSGSGPGNVPGNVPGNGGATFSSRGKRVSIPINEFRGGIGQYQFANFQDAVVGFMSAAMEPNQSTFGFINVVNFNGNIEYRPNDIANGTDAGYFQNGSINIIVNDSKPGSFASVFTHYRNPPFLRGEAPHITLNPARGCVKNFKLYFKDNFGYIILSGARTSSRTITGNIEYVNSKCYCTDNPSRCSINNYCTTSQQINRDGVANGFLGSFSIPYRHLFKDTCIGDNLK